MVMSKWLEQQEKEDKEFKKEIVKKYNSKKYNDTFREKHKDKLKEKINCECGNHYSYYTKSKHLKTKKHTKFLNKTPINTPLKNTEETIKAFDNQINYII